MPHDSLDDYKHLVDSLGRVHIIGAHLLGVPLVGTPYHDINVEAEIPKAVFGCYSSGTPLAKHLRRLTDEVLTTLSRQGHVEAANERLRRRLNLICSIVTDQVRARRKINTYLAIPYLYPLMTPVQLIKAGRVLPEI